MTIKELPIIFPAPKSIEFGDSYLELNKDSIKIDENGLPFGDIVHINQNSSFKEEEYELDIGDSGITITAKDDKGVRIGFQTVRQLAMQGASIPYLKIRDLPDLPIRGFMLDISRCKVPTMDTLLYLVDMLSLFKYNRLELYTEHTFAFKNHPMVWADASPMNAKEYEMLNSICKRTGIELVANINSLGHFDRWLRYDLYQPLAESKAPFTDPMGNVRPYPTTLCPDEKSIAFMDSLYSEFLPMFSSDKVNIGCDEPWELGMGKSKERCEKDGSKYKLYVEYVCKLNELVKKYNKKAYIWADVLMHDKESVKEISEDITPILWGYDYDHPFEEQCQYMQSLNRKYLLAPGTSTWNSFLCRWQNAFENINKACKCAKEYSAEGAILTNWGDNGNHQPFCGMYLPIVLFAQSAWGQQCTQEEAIDAVSKFVFKDETKNFAKALITLSNADTSMKQNSLPHQLFFGDNELVKKLSEENAMAMIKILHGCDEALNILKLSRLACPDAQMCYAEISLAMDMIRWAINRATTDRQTQTTQQQIGLKLIIGSFERIWLARARIGGLYEASSKIRKIFPQ